VDFRAREDNTFGFRILDHPSFRTASTSRFAARFWCFVRSIPCSRVSSCQNITINMSSLVTNEEDGPSSLSPVSQPTLRVRPALTAEEVDAGLAAALHSDTASGANLLPAINIAATRGTRSRTAGITRARQPTDSPRDMVVSEDPHTLAISRPIAKKAQRQRPL
jgi:hypothetical protein